MSLDIPPIVAFRNLWNQYRPTPEVVADLYRQLAPSLSASGADSPAFRTLEYAGLFPPDTSTDAVLDAFDADFFTAIPATRAVRT